MEQVALVVGEALVDVVRGRDGSERDHAGGSSANAAVAMSRLGRPVWFASAWADDAHGGLLAAHLADNDVRMAVDPLALARTATAVATLAEDGSASYEFDIEWRVPAVSLPVHVAPVVVVYGSIGAALDPGGRRRRRPGRGVAGECADGLRRQCPPGDHGHRRRGGRPGRADGPPGGRRQGERRGPGGALAGADPPRGRDATSSRPVPVRWW